MTSDTKSNVIGEKIKQIRAAEGVSQAQFFELTGIPIDTLKGYETSRTLQVASDNLLKITTHPQFQKYTLWLMTGQVAPDSGQISPELKLTADRLRTGT